MPGEEDVHGREHRHQQADDPAGRPVPPGSARGDRDQPQGVGDPEGQIADAIWPDFEQVVGVLYELARGLYGSAEHPFPAFHVQSRALLESALGCPQLPYYETFYDKLAAMVRSIAANHALEDGNKRLAVTVLHSTLLLNGHYYVWDNDDAVELALRCASGDTDFRWLSQFLEAWTTDGIAVPLDPTYIVLAMDAIRDAIVDTVAEDPTLGAFIRELLTLHVRGQLDTETVEGLVQAARRR